MFVFTSLIVIAVVIFLAFYLKRCAQLWKLKGKFPGPPIKFFFGSALDFAGGKDMLEVFGEYFEKYGDIVFTRLGPLTHTIIFSNADLAKEVFRSSINLTKGPAYDFCESWLGRGLLTAREEKWRDQRKMLNPAFNISHMSSFIRVFEKQAEILVLKLKAIAPTDSVDILSYLSLCSLDIVCEASMGLVLNAQENQNTEYVKAVKETCDIIARRSCSVLESFSTYYMFTKNYRREMENVKLIHGYTDRMIQKKRQERELVKNMSAYPLEQHDILDGIKFNLLDLLLDLFDENKITEKEIKDEVHTFMFAGHDTVTAAMSFFIYEISKHEIIQNLLYQEQMVIIEGQNHIYPDDIPKMKLLDLAIKESMRLFTPVPVYVRKVTKDFHFDGVLIPEGVVLTHVAQHLHRNKKYFPNPDSFDLYRFENSENIVPGSYLPFSTGPRSCIGQKFAMFEMKVILSYIIRQFKIAPAKPEHKMEMRAEIVLTSKNGLHVSLIPR